MGDALGAPDGAAEAEPVTATAALPDGFGGGALSLPRGSALAVVFFVEPLQPAHASTKAASAMGATGERLRCEATQPAFHARRRAERKPSVVCVRAGRLENVPLGGPRVATTRCFRG